MDESERHSVWRAPRAVLDQPGDRPARTLWRSAIVGVLVSSCTLVTLRTLSELGVIWYARSTGVPLWTARGTLLRFSVPILWSIAVLAGGFAGAWSSGRNWPAASIVVALSFVLVWSVIAALLIGSPTAGHIVAIACAVPASALGGYLASRVSG